MGSHRCLGCNRRFESSRSLSGHTARCVAYRNRHKSVLRGKMGAPTIHPVVDTAPFEGESSSEGAETHNSPETHLLQRQMPATTTFEKPEVSSKGLHSHPQSPTGSENIHTQLSGNSVGLEDETLFEPPKFTTETNEFGVYRTYTWKKPTFIPHSTDSNTLLRNSSSKPRYPDAATPTHDTKTGTLSTTTELLMGWLYNGCNTKSFSDMNSLVHNVLLHPKFNLSDLAGFDASKEAANLDQYSQNPCSSLTPEDGWIETSVSISLPPPNRGKHPSESEAPKYAVKGLFYRKPLEVIKAAFTEENATQFHLSPFEEYWKPSPDSPPERLFSEIYNSDAFLREQDKINSKCMLDDELELVIAPLLIWSDSTHLSSFGTASLWPIYLYLGNESKYTRGKPTTFAAHHMAYIPKLDDAIQDFYTQEFGKPATPEILTHLRRELMHEIWRLIMDDEFMDAYINGIVIEFQDGIRRRLFLRFFIYSADYPEKVLLACIKYLGRCLCPRCLAEKSMVRYLGAKRDMTYRINYIRTDSNARRAAVKEARELIYEHGYSIISSDVKELLDPQSLTPTRNAFSERLQPHGFNFYELFCPDLMHEFELGVWKATLIHLIRILHARGKNAIQLFNERYRSMPTFGRDTIRKFSNNVSELKKLAARDYEDLLQCAIPAFEGLLDEKNNTVLMNLLFELAMWHALAKLRLHTETTIQDLENSTTRLGMALRMFESTTCQQYATKELPSEEARRGRRAAAQAAKSGLKPKSTKSKGKEKASEGSKQQKFNLSTYKLHALGDYPYYIRLFGTTDNFSTQTGELEHRRAKRFYSRSHKGNFVFGIAKHTRRERILRNLGTYQDQKHVKTHSKRRRLNSKLSNATGVILPFDVVEEMPAHSPYDHYEMSHDTRHPLELATWLGDNEDDPALIGFHDQLRDHLLGRIRNQGQEWDGDDMAFTDVERAEVRIVGGCIYRHKVVRINYTTYDMQRDQDSLNPRTHANIMLLSRDETEHPYWYARIVGVFHAIVQHSNVAEPTIMDFLWVRWYGYDTSHQSRYGWKPRRLPRVGFIRHKIDKKTGLSPSFGFIDPAHVIRGVHLLPAFQHGTTDEDLPPSVHARLPSEDDCDYNFYYINFFSDRDMVMRFRGGGVGHSSTRDATDVFRKDRHRSDLAKPTSSNPTHDLDQDSSESDIETSPPLESGYVSEGSQVSGDEDLPLEWPESEAEEVEEADGLSDDQLGPEDGLGDDVEDEPDFGFASF